MTDEQEAYDAKRRKIAEHVVGAVGQEIEESSDPTAWVAGLVLAAGVLGIKHNLGEVFELVSDDLDRDYQALQSGDWKPGEYSNGE